MADTWFRAYMLDDHGCRGTSILPPSEFGRVQEHISSAQIVDVRGNNLSVRVSETDLRMLEGKAVPLRTRVAHLGGVAAMFGDFEIAPVAMAKLGLFHLGGKRFNAFRISHHYTALDAEDVPVIAARLPSARLVRNGPQTIMEIGDADFGMLLGRAEEA